MIGLVDNDILLKLASYGLFENVLGPICEPSNLGVLGAARFVLRKAAIEKNPESATRVIGELDRFIQAAKVIEPTEDEQKLAAKLERLALEKGVALDPGESQLCAIAISQGIHQLLTGDKRAIEALEQLLDSNEALNDLCGKIVCLEDLVRQALSPETFDEIQSAVCSEPAADKVLAICFNCRSGHAVFDSTKECLDSYINELQRKAPRIYPLAGRVA